MGFLLALSMRGGCGSALGGIAPVTDELVIAVVDELSRLQDLLRGKEFLQEGKSRLKLESFSQFLQS